MPPVSRLLLATPSRLLKSAVKGVILGLGAPLVVGLALIVLVLGSVPLALAAFVALVVLVWILGAFFSIADPLAFLINVLANGIVMVSALHFSKVLELMGNVHSFKTLRTILKEGGEPRLAWLNFLVMFAAATPATHLSTQIVISLFHPG